MGVCAIHQPNYFPWLGYFDKIRSADAFVFLDDVAYPRAGSKSMASWTNRVKLQLDGDARWFGCPVRKAPMGEVIQRVEISDAEDWRSRSKAALERNYSSALKYEQVMPLIFDLIDYEAPSIAEFNKNAIQRLARFMNLECTFYSQSELGTRESATDLLVEILRLTGHSTYLCGGGAGGYQEDHLFEAAGLKLKYQGFTPKPYGDLDRFIPGLSVIDFLMTSGDWADF